MNGMLHATLRFPQLAVVILSGLLFSAESRQQPEALPADPTGYEGPVPGSLVENAGFAPRDRFNFSEGNPNPAVRKLRADGVGADLCMPANCDKEGNENCGFIPNCIYAVADLSLGKCVCKQCSYYNTDLGTTYAPYWITRTQSACQKCTDFFGQLPSQKHSCDLCCFSNNLMSISIRRNTNF